MSTSDFTNKPRRIVPRPPNYVTNQVIITTVGTARNDNMPHYLAVAASASPAATSYGEPVIDGIFQRLGAQVQSISRVYMPQTVASALAPASGGRSLALPAISAAYNDSEDALGLSRTYQVKFSGPVNIPQVCAELQASNAIEEARPNYICEAFQQPNDEFYGYQWGPVAINCETGWTIENGHPDVVVAIVDSGVDLQHDDLAAKLKPGYDFVDFQGWLGWRYLPLGDYRQRDPEPDDEDGHGTHCAGIAAALSNNEIGVAGTCWGGRILPVRVMFRVYDMLSMRETSVGTDVDIDAGIKFAVDQGAHVINLSLGGGEPSHEKVLQYAYDQNVCVCAATGNANSNDPSYPAANPRVLAVGAIDANKSRASFSNYGPAYNRFVMAPGVDIASTYTDNSYVYLDGTSMATPFASGLAALVISVGLRSGKRFTADDVYAIIRDTAQPLGTGKGDPFYGEGLIDVQAALEAAKQRL
jgi:subtilisin family serine protease